MERPAVLNGGPLLLLSERSLFTIFTISAERGCLGRVL